MTTRATALPEVQQSFAIALEYLHNCDLSIPLRVNPDRGIAMVTILQITLAHHGFSHEDQRTAAEALLAALYYTKEVKDSQGVQEVDQEELIRRVKQAIVMSGASGQVM